MRLALIERRDDRHRFVWTLHHMLFDGWSQSIVRTEVLTLYEAFSQGRELELERPRPYGDYIAWLSQQDASRAEAFWTRDALRLHGADAARRGPPGDGGEERFDDRRARAAGGRRVGARRLRAAATGSR